MYEGVDDREPPRRRPPALQRPPHHSVAGFLKQEQGTTTGAACSTNSRMVAPSPDRRKRAAGRVHNGEIGMWLGGFGPQEYCLALQTNYYLGAGVLPRHVF